MHENEKWKWSRSVASDFLAAPCSPPGSSAHGIFQARVLEWGAIAFSNLTSRYLQMKRNPCHWRSLTACMLSCFSHIPLWLQSCATLCPPGSSVRGDSPGQNIGVGCHAFLQRISPTQGSNPDTPAAPALQADSFTTGPLGKPRKFQASLQRVRIEWFL